MAFDLEATIGVLFNKNLASIGSIQLDASVREVHTSSAQVTEHPVEDGANVTDHVIQRPDTLVIEGIISNTTLIFPQGLGLVAPVRALGNALNNISNDLAQTGYLGLLELLKGKGTGISKSVNLVKIVTTLRTYENMLLENITVTRDYRSGNALFFTATAREIRLVTTKTADLAKAGGKIASKAKKSQGPKPTSPAPTAVQESGGTSASRVSGIGRAL